MLSSSFMLIPVLLPIIAGFLWFPMGLRLHDNTRAREAALIRARYGLDGAPPLTQRETAAKLGISRSYVSRIEKKALEKLRRALEN